MAHRRRGLDLDHETLGAKHRGEFRLQDFDRDFAVVLFVEGEIHRRHAARAEFALDAVAAGEGGGEAVRDGRAHFCPAAHRRRTSSPQLTATCTLSPRSEGFTITNVFPSGDRS